MSHWPTASSWPAANHWPTGVAHPSSAPAMFLAGQSNAGNQDSVAGTVDTRVSLTWSSMYSGVIDGPGPMRMQTAGVSTGHSFEWQAGADLAAAFGADIITAKFWADGSIVEYFLPVWNIHWPGLSAALTNFALQCVAAGVTQAELAWCQGESNTSPGNVGTLPTYESDTSQLFDLMKALLAGHGLATHFTIIQTNIHIQGSDPASLAFVRAAQANLAAVRADTSIINLDFLVNTLHYGSGQTNTGGSVLVASILERY